MEFTVANILGLIGLFVTTVSTIVGVYVKLNHRMNSIEKDSTLATAIVARELQDYKLAVAEKYVSSEALAKIEADSIRMETKMTSAIEALTDRIDRLLSRDTPKPG